ncbi:hypothetical protein QE152_g39753 [Popillia japonica]|uniref:Uncharacterized protein n=1 Tax=Popillia japonica TaxID=7064 RepID=A0AAW1HSX8_POPJA
MFKASEAIEELVTWMSAHDLERASQKTEAAILKGPRKRVGVSFNIMGKRVVPQHVVNKVEASRGALARIMPNVGSEKHCMGW